MRPLVVEPVDSGVLDSSVHWGQRFAKPGLSGFSSNSSLQMAQTLMGKGISDSGDYFKSLLVLISGRSAGMVSGTEVVWERLCLFARMMAGQGGHR
jgi:hypothetical protein